MRILVLILMLGSACSGVRKFPGSKPTESVDENWVCNKRMSSTSFLIASEKFHYQKTEVSELKITLGGGYCTGTVAYAAKKVDGRWQVGIDQVFNGDEKFYALTENENLEFDNLISNLEVSKVHPEGCRNISDYCDKIIELSNGSEKYKYRPDSLSGASGTSGAWITHSPFQNLADMMKRLAPPIE